MLDLFVCLALFITGFALGYLYKQYHRHKTKNIPYQPLQYAPFQNPVCPQPKISKETPIKILKEELEKVWLDINLSPLDKEV